MWWQYQVGDINVDWVSMVQVPEAHGRVSAWNMNLLAVHPDVDVIAMGVHDRLLLFRPSPPWSSQPPLLLAEKQFSGRVTRVAVHLGFASPPSCCFLVTLMSQSVALVFCGQGDIQQTVHYETGDSAWGCCGNALFTAASSTDWNIRVWSRPTGACHVLSGHTDNIPSVESSEDGQLLVTTSIDCTVRVWDVQSGDQIAAFRGSGWGWSAHLIKQDDTVPMAGPPKPFSVHKCAPSRPLDETATGLSLRSLLGDHGEDAGDAEGSAPDDQPLTRYAVEDSPEDNPEDDTASQHTAGSGDIGFRLMLGDNVYSSIWEIAANPDLAVEAWDVGRRGDVGHPENVSQQEDVSHRQSDNQQEQRNPDHIGTSKSNVDHGEESRQARFKSKLLGKYWIAFTTNSDFYLLVPQKDGRLEPGVHYNRLLHLVVAPDQRALFLNQSLVWSLDRLAFSVYIPDLSVLLIANQMGFVIAVRIADEHTCFKLAFPRADQPVHPIAGMAVKRLQNVDQLGVYLVYILRLDGSLETLVLRRIRCTERRKIA